ncbi:MAG: PG0541 family transporter-associated protein [Paludibacteraceae bacterium]
MKSIFISFDQAHKEEVIQVLDKNLIRGFTFWEGTQGRGTIDGEPHYGSHAWPSLNNSIMTIAEDDKVKKIMDALKKVDEISPMLGLRVFVWNIEEMY